MDLSYLHSERPFSPDVIFEPGYDFLMELPFKKINQHSLKSQVSISRWLLLSPSCGMAQVPGNKAMVEHHWASGKDACQLHGGVQPRDKTFSNQTESFRTVWLLKALRP